MGSGSDSQVLLWVIIVQGQGIKKAEEVWSDGELRCVWDIQIEAPRSQLAMLLFHSREKFELE